MSFQNPMKLMASMRGQFPSTSGQGRRVGRGRRMRGGDLWGIGNFFRNKVGPAFKDAGNYVYNKALKPGYDYVKDHPLTAIGTAASFIPGPIGWAGKALGVAGKITGKGRRRIRRRRIGGSAFSDYFNKGPARRGKGRRRIIRRRRRVGGSLLSILKRGHAYVKEKRLVSNALKHFGHKRLGNAAHTLGYGKRRRVVRRRRGGSLLSLLKKGHDYVKSKRLISSGLRHFGHIRASNFAGALGYGRSRRRRVVRRRRGGSLLSLLKRGHNYVKEKRLVSNALKHFGHKRLGNAAHTLGYGKRKRRVIRRRRGGSLLSILRKGHDYVKSKRLISSGLRHFGHIRASNFAGALGYGRKKRRIRRRRY